MYPIHLSHFSVQSSIAALSAEASNLIGIRFSNHLWIKQAIRNFKGNPTVVLM